jgi:hypothetical protein
VWCAEESQAKSRSRRDLDSGTVVIRRVVIDLSHKVTIKEPRRV